MYPWSHLVIVVMGHGSNPLVGDPWCGSASSSRCWGVCNTSSSHLWRNGPWTHFRSKLSEKVLPVVDMHRLGNSLVDVIPGPKFTCPYLRKTNLEAKPYNISPLFLGDPGEIRRLSSSLYLGFASWIIISKQVNKTCRVSDLDPVFLLGSGSNFSPRIPEQKRVRQKMKKATISY